MTEKQAGHTVKVGNMEGGHVEGDKHDKHKLDWTLLPVQPVQQVIQVLEFGKKKYSANNWKRVPDARRRYLAAAFRHLAAISDGEWLDQESGLPHAACAVCSLLFLLWFVNEGKGESE